jgi:hypothetical protein
MDRPLSLNDLVFVNAYFEHQRSAVKAYRLSHPNASYATARVEAYRVRAKPSVKSEIARRVEHEQGITRELVSSRLLTALQWAEQSHDPVVLSSVTMDCAKLAGFLVEKREVKDVTEKVEQLRSLVRQTLQTDGKN